jgi:putative lipoprotein
MNKHWFLVLAGILLLVTACSEPVNEDESPDASQPPQTLAGEVFYNERYYVPAGAKLNLFLETVPEGGTSPDLIATSTTLLAGQQPYRFTLDYSPADIDARKQYTLRATIMFYDELLFTSATRLDPFTQPEDTISMRVTLVGTPAP